MLVTIQPPSAQGQAPVPSSLQAAQQEAGWLWRRMGLARGKAAPAHTLPCVDQHSRGRPLPPSTNAGLSPFPPAAALRLCTRVCRALHGPAPVPESVCLCLDGQKGEADALSSRRDREQGNRELRLEGQR